jgi:hypothetical protein
MRPAPDRDALIVAMAVVPGIFSRNKHFAFYADPEVRRARARASQIRGIVRQLAGAHGETDGVEIVRAAGGWELRFRIDALRLDRRVALGELEAACVRYLAQKAGSPHITASEEDRVLVERTLRKLAAELEPG